VLNKDQAIGAVILVASVAGVVVYGWLLYALAMVVLQVTAFLAVAAVLVIIAWIGWTMATTPPLETIDLETPTTVGSEEAAGKPAGERQTAKPKTQS